MSYMDTTTRPAETGGIDLSGIDVEAAIFEAGGGLLGGTPETTLSDSVGTAKTPDQVTNGGDGAISDHFDLSQPPADTNDLVKLVAEPEGSNPHIDLIAPDTEPHFANGGSEGIGNPAVVAAGVGIVAITVALIWAIDKLTNPVETPKVEPAEVPEGTKINKYPEEDYTDPNADTGTLQSPAEMMASFFEQSGIKGLDANSPEIADLVGSLMDNIGKVTDLVSAIKGMQQVGDSDGMANAVAELMGLVGLDKLDIGLVDLAPQDFQDMYLDSFDLVGGLNGAADFKELQGADYEPVVLAATLPELELMTVAADTLL